MGAVPLINARKWAIRLGGLVVCALPLCWLLATDRLKILLSLRVELVVTVSALIVIGYFFSGVQYYRTLAKLGCRLSKLDILFFPFMQSFWGLVIPFQGTTLFAATYLKVRYRFKVVDSAAMVIFLYMLNFLFGGGSGVVCSLLGRDLASPLFVFSVVSLGMPMYFLGLACYLRKSSLPRFVPRRIEMLLRSFFSSLHILLVDWKELLALSTLQVLRQLCYCTLFVFVARGMGIDAGWTWGYLVAVGQELSVAIKFTPGNLGIAELMAGIVSGLTGVAVADGIAISFTMTIIQMALCVIIGGMGNILFLRGIRVIR